MSESLLEKDLYPAHLTGAATPRQARNAALDATPIATTPVQAGAETAPLTPGDAIALFPEDELHNFRARWDRVQTSFVDEPRAAVEHADSLVGDVVRRIAEQFSSERERLEVRWAKGSDVSTEELRQALRRYRSLFDRLLSF